MMNQKPPESSNPPMIPCENPYTTYHTLAELDRRSSEDASEGRQILPVVSLQPFFS